MEGLVLLGLFFLLGEVVFHLLFLLRQQLLRLLQLLLDGGELGLSVLLFLRGGLQLCDRLVTLEQLFLELARLLVAVFGEGLLLRLGGLLVLLPLAAYFCQLFFELRNLLLEVGRLLSVGVALGQLFPQAL